ncbi:Ohr family peroxiredoxin [Variovorax sp. Sphag1AA]|uniref:Ohr family peroxiredoxin n=1 Tax=Variovorax sp. Sphag1AA TaxID=2587027 RepID=UPI00161626BB|nr:Ohr family peroxiredoxin [Variovorax sp. Sphag1AA]MBB3182464.1 Ohr subfamily peroxiredoxin [Variovorax sp. Sphag1AA]
MTKLTTPPVSLLDLYQGDTILPLYSTTVVVGGGEARHARSSGVARSDDGELDLVLRLPKQLGGNGGGTNPEQLFAAGYAACFHGAMTLVALKRKVRLPADLEIKATVTFGRDPGDGLFLITAELQVALPSMNDEEADELISETEKICPYAKMASTGYQSNIRRI